MLEKKPNTTLKEKLKNAKINRATVITAVILVAALVVIIAVTVSTNRSRQNSDVPSTNPPVTTRPITTLPPTTQPPATQPPSDSPVEEKLPTFSLPVNGVLSKLHDPTLQVYSNTMNDYRVHIGVDIVTEASAPVYAAADGKISKIWEDTLMGYCIAIKHSGDSYTVYKNLAQTIPEGIAEGVSVKSGQLIASVGESAMVEIADEPHLHFELTVADLAQDPIKYFDEAAQESLKYDGSHGE